MRHVLFAALLALVFLLEENDVEAVGSIPGLTMEPTGIHISQSGTVTITSRLGRLACVDGSLELYKPTIRWPDSERITNQILIENYGDAEEQSVTIGPYVAGTELVFRITPKSFICLGNNFLSTDPLHARVKRVGRDHWLISWEDYSDADFNDLFVEVKVEPMGVVNGPITITEQITTQRSPFSERPSYKLPWESNQSHLVSQIPNFENHVGANAYDFSGEFTVVAPERGLVLWVEDYFGPGTCDVRYQNLVNVIVIQTAENTQISFVHLKGGSAQVSVGDVVEQGDTLAVSDRSGFSCGSHLHLEFQEACHTLLELIQIREEIERGKHPKATLVWYCSTKKPYYSDGFWVAGRFIERLRAGVWYTSDNN